MGYIILENNGNGDVDMHSYRINIDKKVLRLLGANYMVIHQA